MQLVQHVRADSSIASTPAAEIRATLSAAANSSPAASNDAPASLGVAPPPGTELSDQTKASLAAEWARFSTAVSRIAVDGQAVPSLLGLKASSWNFSLPPSALRRGYAISGGNSHRLRRVLRDLEAGSIVKVGGIGSSTSWGVAVVKGKQDWFSMVTSYLSAAYPSAKVVGRNSCGIDMPTVFMETCHKEFVDEDVDLVFVEYSANDLDSGLKQAGFRAAYERVVRQLLAKPKAPAVVLVSLPVKGMAHPPDGRALAWAPMNFSDTSEDAYTVHAQYYDLPALSLRTAVWRLAEFQEHGMSWSSFYGCCHDYVHLLAPGHKAVADLVVYMLQKVALGLAMQPWNSQDEAAVVAPLQPPMMPGNQAGPGRVCVYGSDITNFVARTVGFEMVEDGSPDNPKWGMLAEQPGAELEFELSTKRTTKPQDAPMTVQIAYLTASEGGLGQVFMSCAANCLCPVVHVNAHTYVRTPMIALAHLQPTQHALCRIRVTILPNTTSGGHKFKVTGLLAHEYVGNQLAQYLMPAQDQPPVLQQQGGLFGRGGMPASGVLQQLLSVTSVLAVPCVAIALIGTGTYSYLRARRAQSVVGPKWRP